MMRAAAPILSAAMALAAPAAAQVPAVPQVPSAPQAPPALPDLRIASVELSPEIPRARTRLRIRVLVHNDSGVAAAGRIGVQVAHDRGSLQPQPALHEILYLGADELAELTFDVYGIDLESSPYQFFATVDLFDVVEESDESNNAASKRIDVCGSPEFTERVDGLDNDCDGMVDEGLGLEDEPDMALRMLRELQARAIADRAQLVYSLPRLFAPFARIRRVTLSRAGGPLIGLRDADTGVASPEGDAVGELRAPPPATGAGSPVSGPPSGTEPGEPVVDPAELTMVDWNGGELRDGDLVSFRAVDGRWLAAARGRDAGFVPSVDFFEAARLFSVALRHDEAPPPADTTETAAAAPPSPPVVTDAPAEAPSPEVVRAALGARRRRFVAIDPASGALTAAGRRVDQFTTFLLTLMPDEPVTGENQ